MKGSRMTPRIVPEPLEGMSCHHLSLGILWKEQIGGKIRSSVSDMLSCRAMSGRQAGRDFQ